MRVLPYLLLIAALCLTGPGCALFGKKNANNGGGGLFGGRGGGREPAKFPGGPDDPLQPGAPQQPPAAPPTPGGTETALLAGRVIDPYNRPPNNTYIRWVCVEENKETAAPIDVAVNPEGYFTIQGLKTGAYYKLMARSKQGEKLFAGVTVTQAPNVRVVILVKEDFVTPSTPPVPGNQPAGAAGAQEPEKKEQAKTPAAGVSIGPSTAWSPTAAPAIPAPTQGGGGAVNAGAVRPAAEPDLPGQLTVPAPAPAAPTAGPPQPQSPPAWVPGVANTATPPSWPPTLDIKAPRPQPVNVPPLPKDPPRAPAVAPGEAMLNGPARIPSAVVVGNRVENLALNDTNGQPWEFRKQRTGKLVLFDFWATYCNPCRETMPELAKLQARYGAQGLEVIGVALEASGTLKEQGERVNLVCHRAKTNYRQLLGEERKSNIRAQFGIKGIPALVLVDEQGVIRWRIDGKPDHTQLQALDRFIQSSVSNRRF